MIRCQAKKRNGNKCSRVALCQSNQAVERGEHFCWQHKEPTKTEKKEGDYQVLEIWQRKILQNLWGAEHLSEIPRNIAWTIPKNWHQFRRQKPRILFFPDDTDVIYVAHYGYGRVPGYGRVDDYNDHPSVEREKETWVEEFKKQIEPDFERHFGEMKI